MQHPTPNVSQSSQKRGQLAPESNPARQFIFIRIRRHLVLPISTDAMNPPPINPQFSSHLYLLEGTFEDFRRFAGTTVDWIIKISHLICDPLGTGQVYTHTTGTTSDWYNEDRAASWRQVAPGDVLLPGIYEFEPATHVLLSQISVRQSHSVTSLGAESSSSTFRRDLNLRDSACVVTRLQESIIASHLFPKRIGSDGAKSIVTRFSGQQAALDIHRFHPKIGILLISPLDSLVDHYDLGFYHVMGNTYVLHDFGINNPDRSAYGFSIAGIFANTTVPRLHNFQTILSVHGGDESLPPKGVFDWHYLQCAIKRFGTPAYKYLPNIQFFVYPYKLTSDVDSSDEYPGGDEIEPPYPSYYFDQYLARQGERQRGQELRKEVAQWSSEIFSGI